MHTRSSVCAGFVLAAALVPFASTASARKLDLEITATATQTIREVSTQPCLESGSVTGVRTEELTLKRGRPGRFFLTGSTRLVRAGDQMTATLSTVRSSSFSTAGPPLGCGGDPEQCGERKLRVDVQPALISTLRGRVLGFAVGAAADSTEDPYPLCGGGTPGLLAPPLFTLGVGGSARPERYVYARLPRGFAGACSRRRANVGGTAREVARDGSGSTETVMRFRVSITRLGCLGR